MSQTLVAIHQPNFFPWLGFFDKVARADVFVMLDSVQFAKTGGTWSNRVRMMIGGRAAWLTMPIVRSYHDVRTYREMLISDVAPWRAKHLKTIKLNYVAAPYFGEIFPVLQTLFATPTSGLAAFNEVVIRALCEGLQLDTGRLIQSSTLPVTGHATDLLIAIVQAVGGTAYLAGGLASVYQEDDKFAKAGIELIYQNFQHPTYPQVNSQEFVPGLSIVDALMNCGWQKTRQLLYAQETNVASQPGRQLGT
jgi:hypothetical protein